MLHRVFLYTQIDGSNPTTDYRYQVGSATTADRADRNPDTGANANPSIPPWINEYPDGNESEWRIDGRVEQTHTGRDE